MTDAELLAAHAARKAAMAITASCPQTPIGRLGPHDRERVDRAWADHERLDAAIVAELRRRGVPARLGAVDLHLTRELDGFAALDPATGDVLPRRNAYDARLIVDQLFDYARPIAGRGRGGEAAP